MAKINYKPVSHFFTEQSKIATPNSADYITDAFGPVIDPTLLGVNNTPKYRTTSKLRINGTAKIFAICNGQVLIQPQTGDATKVNILIKPSQAYAPLKIKYFVYRGVRKSDLIDGGNITTIDPAIIGQPDILKRMWQDFKAFNQPLVDLGIITSPLPAFQSTLIGFDENTPQDTLIENIFSRSLNSSFYQLPICKKGEHLGYVVGEMGLDIVLDYGDSKLVDQMELFKFDLAFAQKNENILDTTTILNSTSILINRYKEYIHQFIDAAAFWGSHIKFGKIKLNTNPTDITSNADIYNNILSKYQTKNKLYVYIQGENNRSYNFFDTSRTIEGFAAPQLNDTSGWPIIIQELSLSSPSPNNKTTINFTLEYNIDIRIPEQERHVSIDVICPGNDTTKYPALQRPKTTDPLPIGRTSTVALSFQTSGTKSCACFLLLIANLKQEFPLTDYYNKLWPANIAPNYTIPVNSTEYCYWATYDRNRIVNLDDALDAGAIVQNKIVFDTGNYQDPSGTILSKKRRLYIASVKRNTQHSDEYNNLNIDVFNAGIVKKTSSTSAEEQKKQYFLSIYNDTDFAVYKGNFTDPTEVASVNSLVSSNEKDFYKRSSYFHLGITDEEYNMLVYDNVAPSTSAQLPLDADNIFFSLEEDLAFPNQNVRKFKVGLQYEDSTGAIAPPLYPATSGNIFVYTLDGLYYFSKDYSKYHEFFSQFAKATVEFRTIPIGIPASGTTSAIPAYNGEFGFDWLRIGDNGETDYESLIEGGYERPTNLDPTNTEFEYDMTLPGSFNDTIKALKREYNSLPMQTADEQYFIPYLTLFSKNYSNSIITIPALPYKATLGILVKIDESLNKLEFDYDTSLFTIDKPVLTDNVITVGKIASQDKTIEITCLRDFSEAKQIRVLAYPVGVSDKKQAKLAGLIIVNKNNKYTRQSKNFVLIPVRTKITGGVASTGIFMADEKLNLINILSQSLLTCKIIIGPILDLSGETDFQQQYDPVTTAQIKSGFINSSGGILANHHSSGLKIHSFLKTRFLNDSPSNTIYTHHFIVFSFDNPGYKPDLLGHVDKIGSPLVVLYKTTTSTSLVPRDLTTLNHESMHGLGLYHTHRDNPIIEPQIKYIYLNTYTDNVMSYNSNAITLWQWQRKFIKVK